jgi:hypothetical protein
MFLEVVQEDCRRDNNVSDVNGIYQIDDNVFSEAIVFHDITLVEYKPHEKLLARSLKMVRRRMRMNKKLRMRRRMMMRMRKWKNNDCY